MTRKFASPVIVVPGVTATYLRDLYPLPPETIWKVLDGSKHFERVQMHPDAPRYEAAQPSVVRPDQIYEVAYRELVEELRHDLSPSPDEPVPVYPFGYDWRHPLRLLEGDLATFIDEVIDRTKLMRHYFRDDYPDAPKVNLVGHSMGGLVIAGYVERFGGDKIDKVATLATPYRGSFEAIVKLVTGTANLGGSVPSSREREAARMTPSLYHLLPDFETGVTVEPGLTNTGSIWDPDIYQPSIVESIVSYVDKHAADRGSNKAKREEQGHEIFARFLAEARDHRARISNLVLADKGLSADLWLCVAGVHSRTRVRMTIAPERGKPSFLLTSHDLFDEWEGEAGDPNRTGDGTVHFAGAQPGFLARENLICVTPDDFGDWELQDRAATKLAGFHGILPNMNMLHRMLTRHFTGSRGRSRNTWGRKAPGLAGPWAPAIDLREKS